MNTNNVYKNNKNNKKKSGCMKKFSSYFSSKISHFFYRLGVLVATHPWKTLILCLTSVGVLSLGLFNFYSEKNPMVLWVPENAKILKDTDWIFQNFEEGYLQEMMIITAPNVLEPKNLKKVAILQQAVNNFTITLKNGTSAGLEDLCFKVPIITDDGKSSKKEKRDIYNLGKGFYSILTSSKANRPFNPSVDLNPKIFCKLVNRLKLGCLEQNLLQAWKNDEEIISNQTLDSVLDTINTMKTSPVTGHEFNSSIILGGIERNNDGEITSAKALLSIWHLYINLAKIEYDVIGNNAGTEDWSTPSIMAWEKSFLDLMFKLQNELEDDEFKIYINAARSFGDISSVTMFQDIDKLIYGGIIMIIFMQIVLSKCTWTEIRIGLAVFGLISVLLGFIAACGFCSLLSIPYGPVHTSLPFLLLGLGVDDMFVLMANWRKVQETKELQNQPLNIKMGHMLKNAGVSITITSITDMVVFLVGATTILPSLKSFCLFSAFGVLFVYIYVITLFVAIFTIDEQRIDANRNSIFPCIIHSKKNSDPICDKSYMKLILDFLYTKIILTKSGNIIVILIVFLYTGFAIESSLKLEQQFDPNWFIPKSTYLGKYLNISKEYYSTLGFDAGIYMGKINYTQEIGNIIKISEKLNEQNDILFKVESWVEPFRKFVDVYYEKDLSSGNITDEEFHLYLSKFLFTQDGGKYQANFRFKSKLICGNIAPEIKVAAIRFIFKRFEKRNEFLPAQNRLDVIVKEGNITTGDKVAFVWGKVYANWITDEIIDVEAIRNICLALICVMFCTLIFIVDIQICFWVFICIILTLINVAGYIQRWGLTIDIVTSIGVQLGIGLCVDYAAHVGHTFLTISDGNRKERAKETVLHIGAAVLYGGISTLIPLTLLYGSEAYSFIVFFKVFSLVVFFGLFHGVVLLPVILSLIGPSPYTKLDEDLLDLNKSNKILFIQPQNHENINNNCKEDTELQPINS